MGGPQEKLISYLMLTTRENVGRVYNLNMQVNCFQGIHPMIRHFGFRNYFPVTSETNLSLTARDNYDYQGKRN